MPWKLYYEIQFVVPAVLYSDRYDAKEEALEKVFEYYNNPSQGICVLRLDHLSGEAMNKAKIEEWCRERRRATSPDRRQKYPQKQPRRYAAGLRYDCLRRASKASNRSA